MEEEEIKDAVAKIIADAKIDAQIISCEYHFDNKPTVIVEVNRKDYERACMLETCFDDYRISWRQKQPTLVAAEVGDLVLIYSDRHADDDDSDVGLVTAKFTSEDGSVCYGCRYIKIGLGNSFLSPIYDFELTSENYGGFPTGFLRILTQQEAIEHLDKQLKIAYEKELKAAKAKFDRSAKALPSLVAFFAITKIVKCDRIELDENLRPFSLKE